MIDNVLFMDIETKLILLRDELVINMLAMQGERYYIILQKGH